MDDIVVRSQLATPIFLIFALPVPVSLVKFTLILTSHPCRYSCSYFCSLFLNPNHAVSCYRKLAKKTAYLFVSLFSLAKKFHFLSILFDGSGHVIIFPRGHRDNYHMHVKQ